MVFLNYNNLALIDLRDLKSELKALAEKFDKLDSKYNRLE